MAATAVQFHGLTMNGGFLHSFAATPSRLHEVEAAFDLLRLGAAADLIRVGIELIPELAGADAETRPAIIDGLSEEASARLEELGNRYTERVSDTLLGDRIARFATPRKRLPRLPRSVPEMLTEYVETLIERDAALKASQIARANRLFRRNHDLYLLLRLTDEGRDGIWALRGDDRPAVRQAAVTHSLPWHPDEAVRLLEEMRAAGSFEAIWILKEWRAGTLKLDW